MSGNHVKHLRGGSGMSVVERVVLKWSHMIKPPGKLSSCYISNISTSGDVVVAITHKKGANEYGELTLFNSDGKIALSKRYGDEISDPQLSDDGNIITVKRGSGTLEAYNKRGELLWTYNIEKGRLIGDYKLSRNGKYAVIAVAEVGLFGLESHFILLRDGVVEWTKSSKGVAVAIAISPNNEYIVSASSYKGKTRAALYTIDGVELWNTVVEGTPLHIDVSDNGEVLLSTYFESTWKILFIAEGRILWDKAGYGFARFARSGDRIIATARGDSGIFVFNRWGEPLWEYQGAFHYVASDNYYVLMDNKGVILVSAKGEVLQRIELSEWVKRQLTIWNVYNTISPDGRFFATRIRDDSERMCYLYFFEIRDFLIRGVKEKLLREIDELIRR